jgi:hypothetical protein
VSESCFDCRQGARDVCQFPNSLRAHVFSYILGNGGDVSPHVMWLGNVSNRSTTSSAKVESEWSCTFISPYAFMARIGTTFSVAFVGLYVDTNDECES